MRNKGRFGFRPPKKPNKVTKKRRPQMKDIDLTKPWVTAAIRAEFAVKDELLATAKGTQNKEDWALYRQQREKCSQVYHATEMEFIGQQEVRIPQLLPETNFTRITAPIDYTADVYL